MKSLTDIVNSLQALKQGKTGIIIFDIDDTLVHADGNEIGIIKHINGDRNNCIRLSTDEYAKDPDAAKHKEWFSYEEFRDPIKVVKSIIHGTPLLKNLKIMDAYVNAGYEFCFLTARGCEDAVKYALSSILRIREDDGKLYPIGNRFNKSVSAAVNDDVKIYSGTNDAEKKANVLKKICPLYDYAVFVDDDKKNVKLARDLKIPNLTVIQAIK